MLFNHTSFSELRTQIAYALGDPEMIFTTSENIDSAIEEALLTFGAISGFWKDKFLVNTVDKKKLYNIFTDCTDITKIAPTLRYQDVLDWINRDLIESISQANPNSKLLELNDILDLIEGRYNLYQLQTSLVLSQVQLNIVAQNSIYKVPDNIISLVRVEYEEGQPDPPIFVVIRKEDEVSLSYYDELTLLSENRPEFYTSTYGISNEIRLYPIPANSGKLHMLSVNGQDGDISLDTILNMPNNLVPYIKWGVEADLFGKEGLLNDPARMQYCEQRWNEGIAVGRKYASILSARSDGIPITTDSLFMLDLYTDYVASKRRPDILGLAGLNIFGLDLVPDVDVHSIELVLEHNAIIPTNDDDPVEVELEYIEDIIAYAVHIIAFRSSFEEVQETIENLKGFVRTSLEHNELMRLRGLTYENIMGKSKEEESSQPRIVEA
jgi:hypothetical protein